MQDSKYEQKKGSNKEIQCEINDRDLVLNNVGLKQLHLDGGMVLEMITRWTRVRKIFF